MTTTAPLAKATNQVNAWKDREKRRFRVALVNAALRLYDLQVREFASDCLPETEMPDDADANIVGIVFKELHDAHVIEPVHVLGPDGALVLDDKRKPIVKRRKSNRPDRNAAYINLWRLSSRNAAVEFLARHEPLVDPRPINGELFTFTPEQPN
jgi:hypothetical protein